MVTLAIRLMVHGVQGQERRDAGIFRKTNVIPFLALIPRKIQGRAVAQQSAQHSGMLLSDLGKKYLDHMRASGRTEKHIRNIERLLENQLQETVKVTLYASP